MQEFWRTISSKGTFGGNAIRAIAELHDIYDRHKNVKCFMIYSQVSKTTRLGSFRKQFQKLNGDLINARFLECRDLDDWFHLTSPRRVLPWRNGLLRILRDCYPKPMKLEEVYSNYFDSFLSKSDRLSFYLELENSVPRYKYGFKSTYHA